MPFFISEYLAARMSQFSALLKKEIMLELRQKHALAGLVLYVLATVFVCYLSFGSLDTPKAWGALLWITGIFTAFNAMQKAFAGESHSTQLYLYSLADPRHVIISKAIYNAALVAVLNIVSVLFFILFFGTKAIEGADLSQFMLGLALGSTGLGLALTFIAGLAFRSGGGIGLVAILGFPIIIPLLITIVRHTTFALEGMSYLQNSLNLVVLIVLNAVSLVLAWILFPYLWRE